MSNHDPHDDGPNDRDVIVIVIVLGCYALLSIVLVLAVILR